MKFSRVGALLLEAGGFESLALVEICTQAPDAPSTEIPHRADRRVDRHATASASPLQPAERNHAARGLAVFVRQEPKLLPGAVQSAEVELDTRVAVEDLTLDRAQPCLPFEVGRRDRHEGGNIAPAERVYCLLDDLDVLRRHCLLLEPPGFERFGPIEVLLHAPALLVVHRAVPVQILDLWVRPEFVAELAALR